MDEPDNDQDDELRLELRKRGLPFLSDEERASAWLSPPGLDTAKKSKGGDGVDGGRVLKEVPKYVLDYAPLVHLCSKEHFWPADIAEHVRHVTPHIVDDDDESVPLNITEPLTLHNMHVLLNNYSSTVYLASDNNVEARPEWLYSNIGVPIHSDDDDDEDGDEGPPYVNPKPPKQLEELPPEVQWMSEETTWYDASREHPVERISDPRRLRFQHLSRGRPGLHRRRGDNPPSPPRHHKPDENGYSKAPAVLIVVDKGSGIVDAFWFFFYSYNLGQTVLGIRFGNHVGDWEHTMVRFENGQPRGVFFSEHEGGQAYTYAAVGKGNGRPVIYSAVGSHAMYAMPGVQPYILPFKLLKDVTDKGPIWDPAKNIYAYHYDYMADYPSKPGHERHRSLVPAAENPDAPTGWFHYEGSWGDKVYSLADRRQWRLFGQYHYVTGPSGPKFKKLDRQKMCQTQHCEILHSLEPGRTWYG
jgi:hypothetical protein